MPGFFMTRFTVVGIALLLEETALSALRENTLSGRPTGSKEFVRDLEMRLGRELAKPLMRRPRAVDVDRDNTEDFFGGA